MPYLQIPKLIRLCTKKWPKYPLDINLTWPPNGTLDPDIQRELSNFYQHTRRWEDCPYTQAFFYLSSKPSVLASYSPINMFLPMPSKPEEHPASALYPANKPPSFCPQQRTTSISSDLPLHTNCSISPYPPVSFLLLGAKPQQLPDSSTHFYPSSHVLVCC